MKFPKILRSIFRGVAVAAGYLRPSEPRNKLVVEQYPDLISGRSVADMFPKFKGQLQNDLNRCTGCGDCIAICPVHALQMDSEIARDGSVSVNNFKIDLGRCFSCGACVDICAPASINFSKRYELAAATGAELIVSFQDRKKDGPVEAPRIRAYEVRR